MPINVPIAILLFVSLALLASVSWTALLGAPWQGVSLDRARKMMRMAGVTKKDLVYDLGFGDGRILFTAKEFGAKAKGVEIDPLRYAGTWIYSKIKREKVSLKFGSVYGADLRGATVVTIFLSNFANRLLERKLKKELKKGTRVVTYYWQFKGWKPSKVDKRLKLYMYEIGKSTKT